MTNDAFSLANQVALVTGSATGIGRAIALGLARAGADVVCHGRDDAADDLVAEIRKLGRRSFGISADLEVRATHESIVGRVVAEFGQLDVLVNNAGMIRRAPAVEYSDGDWDALLAVNLTSVFRLSRAAGRHMLERGRGSIVNIASLLAFQGGIRVPAYAATKGAVAQLTKALANEWAARGVNVNAIAPGYIATDNTKDLREDAERNRQIIERIPAARWGSADDVAGAAVFLCSAASRYVHGHVLVVDGGWMAR